MGIELPQHNSEATPGEKALASVIKKTEVSPTKEKGNDSSTLDQERLAIGLELEDIMGIYQDLHRLLTQIDPTIEISKHINTISDVIYRIDILSKNLQEKNTLDQHYHQDMYDILANYTPPPDADDKTKKRYYKQAQEAFKLFRTKVAAIENERTEIVKILQIESIAKNLGEINIKILKEKLDHLYSLIDSRWKN